MNNYSQITTEVTERGGTITVPQSEWDKVKPNGRAAFLREKGYPILQDGTKDFKNYDYSLEFLVLRTEDFQPTCYRWSWWKRD